MKNAKPRKDLITQSIIDSWSSTLLTLAKPGPTQGETNKTTQLNHVLRSLLKEIASIRETYQTDRGQIGGKLMLHLKDALAYQAAFHIPNASRLALLLQRVSEDLTEKWLSPIGLTPAIYDLGCGTGALTVGFLAHIKAPKLRVFGGNPNPTSYLYDSNRHLLKVAQTNVTSIAPQTSVKTRRVELADFTSDRALPHERNSSAVYLLGYVWNEIQKNKRTPIVIMRHFERISTLTKPSMIIVLEPATSGSWDSVQKLRDTLCEIGMVAVYPCPHNQTCPLSGKDRCYSEFEWFPPAFYQKLENLQNMQRTRMASSGFIFVNQAYLGQMSNFSPLNRFVGFPTVTTRGRETFEELLCTSEANIKRLSGNQTENKRLRGSADKT